MERIVADSRHESAIGVASMDKKPFFSIIIPVYNVAPYLRECLDSVLVQTFTDWEAICVDDGSTDGSGAILDEYAAKDQRFRVFHQPNAGVSAARNKGLDEAKGDNILFLDADDIYLSTFVFIRLKEELERSSDDELIVFKYQTFIDNCCQIGSRMGVRRVVSDISRTIYAQTLKILFGEACYRRDMLLGIRFPSRILGEDMVFIGEVLCRVNRVVDIGEVFYGYRTRIGSASHGQSTFRKFSEIIELNHFWLSRFAEAKKALSLDAYDYIAQWLFEWNPQRLKAMGSAERKKAIVKLRQLYRQFGDAVGNRNRYRIAVIIGEVLKSYRLTCLLSGKMPRPHFGLMTAYRKMRAQLRKMRG